MLTARQLAEWEAYQQMEPFGEDRADMRAGIIASTIANVYLKKGAKPLSALDFMPFVEKPKTATAARLRQFFQSREKKR